MAMEVSVSEESSQLQVRFITKQRQYSLPDTTFAVPSSVKTKELNTLVNQLLCESDGGRAQTEFDFLALGEFIRSELGEHVCSRGGSSEAVINVEYVERLPAPEPKDCLLHDDWVSSVHVAGKWILTGCYDSTLHMWTTKGKHKLTIPGHTECVKAVSWVSLNETEGTFISGSHDQTVLLWEWNVEENVVESVHICKGHTRGIECVAVSPDANRFASGGWDNMLKIWSTDLSQTEEDETGESEAKRIKKSKKGKRSQTRSPVMTLAGHREAVSGLCWEKDNTNLISCSWDHTVRVWDIAQGCCSREIPANKAMFDIHINPFNNLLLVASADRHVRLIDTKSSESLVVKSTYTSHSQWVQTVRWSPTNESLFISGGYDNQLKLWDTRSPKVPLYDMRGHEDKILCSDWTDPALMVSGGTDNTVRVFKSKNHPATEPSAE